MRIPNDFEEQFRFGLKLTTVNVIYYMPDYSHIINEFVWQCMDKDPKYPRVHQFIDYWMVHIKATIKQVLVASYLPLGANKWKKVDIEFKL